VTAARSFALRLGRRLRAECANTRRSLALIGLRRLGGPSVKTGVATRPTSSGAAVAGEDPSSRDHHRGDTPNRKST
jgi:hypothetical protein